IGVREDHTVDGEPVNAIVAVDLGDRGGPGHVLASGHDFYASPRLSPDGRWLAWLAWDHPNMPWNGTRLPSARGPKRVQTPSRSQSPAERRNRSSNRNGRPTARRSCSCPIAPAVGIFIRSIS